MKRSISLAVLLCFLAGSALAGAPETALQLLTLGSQKRTLEQSIEPATIATIIADQSVTLSPATLFGISESRLTVTSPSDQALNEKLTAPLVIVLGTEESAIWKTYAEILSNSPELIHAVLKGQTSVLGAIANAESNTVDILGAHPDLLVMAGQYILGKPAQPAQVEETKDNVETPAETPAESAPEAPAEESKADNPAAASPEAHDAAPADKAEHVQEAQSSGGGFGIIGVLLFVAALVGTIVYMDKTVLKS